MHQAQRLSQCFAGTWFLQDPAKKLLFTAIKLPKMVNYILLHNLVYIWPDTAKKLRFQPTDLFGIVYF